jgi:hypothetical protein
MSLTKILTYLLIPVILGMSYYLYASIKENIDETNYVAAVEKQVIQKLSMIREAEQGYLSIYGKYTSDWQELGRFIENGKFPVVDRKEEIIGEKDGQDIVKVTVDTVATISVKDSLFPASKFPNFDPYKLKLIPVSNEVFEIFAGTIDRNGVQVPVIEVVDPKPVNRNRKKDNEILARKPLRIGSRTDATTAGNWE